MPQGIKIRAQEGTANPIGVHKPNHPGRVRGKTKSRSQTAGVYDPTENQYETLRLAFDFFNAHLFEGHLPHVLLTLQRKANSKGYFARDEFQGRSASASSGLTVHEIALNPDSFVGRTDEQIASTLVQEMVHAWQHTCGSPSRPGYHNREWAERMKEVGLCPSRTGEVGGKQTGDKVSHYIIPDGPFARAFRKLEASQFSLQWQSAPRDVGDPKRRQTRPKFTCPGCGLNAWAKPGANLVCGDCSQAMEVVEAKSQAA